MRSGGIGLSSAFLALWILVCPAVLSADISLLAYPDGNAIFQYHPDNYRLVLPGEPLYDPAYDRFGTMLWDIERDRIAYELYQAPGLVGFEPASVAPNTFNVPANKFLLHIDGFSEQPRRLNDIYVRFLPSPPNASTVIYANDERVEGLYYHIPQLIVTSPLSNGFYSDTIDLEIVWSGAESMAITVFADKNGNRVFDGTERYGVFMMDQTVPARNGTWGQIKTLYE